MAGRLTFTIDLQTAGNSLPEVQERLKDLRPAFDVIIRKWADDNRDKFKLGGGAEGTGAEIDPEVFWKALTPGYMKAKRKAGHGDALMVATGHLVSSMTSPEGFFHESTAEQAAFGMPKDMEDEAKLRGNLRTRQVVFLSVDDQRMIDKTVHDYLALGPGFETLMFQQGMEASALRKEQAKMDVDFKDTVGG